jgi:hypothetical protein
LFGLVRANLRGVPRFSFRCFRPANLQYKPEKQQQERYLLAVTKQPKVVSILMFNLIGRKPCNVSFKCVEKREKEALLQG